MTSAGLFGKELQKRGDQFVVSDSELEEKETAALVVVF